MNTRNGFRVDSDGILYGGGGIVGSTVKHRKVKHKTHTVSYVNGVWVGVTADDGVLKHLFHREFMRDFRPVSSAE